MHPDCLPSKETEPMLDCVYFIENGFTSSPMTYKNAIKHAVVENRTTGQTVFVARIILDVMKAEPIITHW